MKLKKLHIENYKNLKEFDLDFENDNGLSIIVGNNGSGKSNILEAISGIFCEWYGKKSEEFKCDYIIEYYQDNVLYSLKKENGRRSFYINEEKQTSVDYADSFLPSNIISVYSGESLNLYNNFFKKSYDSYINSIYNKNHQKKIGMYYVNKYLWDVSFLVLILYSYQSHDIQDFLLKLNINKIKYIRITFDLNKIKYNRNLMLSAFLEKLTINDKEQEVYTLTELQKLLGKQNEDDSLYYQSNELFDLLMQSTMPKETKLVKDIEIIFNENMSLKSLSEGEKKLILLKAVFDFISDEKSILLLDEPDSSIHETRKEDIIKTSNFYANRYRQIILTSHSPLIAKCAKENQLKFLDSKEGKVSILPDKQLKIVQTLASNQWNILESGINVTSEKILFLTEGKSDITFIRKAIELFKNDKKEYQSFDFDFLSFNGTGNVEDFIKNVRIISSNKNMLLVFDRDDAGKKGMCKISNKSPDDESIVHFRDYISEDKKLKAFFYPYTQEISNGDFLVEDYFPQNIIDSILKEMISIRHPYTKNLPGKKTEEHVKSKLEEKAKIFSKEDFEGFKVLLDKIYEMTKTEE